MQIRQVKKRRNRKLLPKSEAETFCKFLCKNLNYQNAVELKQQYNQNQCRAARAVRQETSKFRVIQFSTKNIPTFCAYQVNQSPSRILTPVEKFCPIVMFHLLPDNIAAQRHCTICAVHLAHLWMKSTLCANPYACTRAYMNMGMPSKLSPSVNV